MRIVSDQAIANALKGSKVTPTEKLLRGETKRKTPKAPAGTVFGTKVTPDTRHNLNTLKGAMAHFDRKNPYTNSTPDKLTNPDNIKRQKAKSYLYARANGQEGDFGRYLDEFEALWRMNTGKIDEVIARYKERRGNAAAGDKAPSVIARASVLSAEEQYEKEQLIKKFGTDKPGLSDILSAVGQDISPTNAIRNLATTAAQGVYDLPEDWAPDAENDKLLKAGLMAGNVAEFLIPGLNAAKVASETGSVVAKSAEQKSLAPIGSYVKENLRALNPFESGIDPVERGFRALSLGLTALAVKPHVGGLKVKNFRERGRAVVGIAYEMISPAPTPNVLLPRAEALKAVLSAPAGKETIKVAKEIEKRYMDDDGYAEIRQAYSDKFRAANDEAGALIPEADIDAAVTLLTASDLAIRDQAKGARPDISGDLDVRGVNRNKVQEPARGPAPKSETGKPTKFKPQEAKGYDQGEALDLVGIAKKNEPKTSTKVEGKETVTLYHGSTTPGFSKFDPTKTVRGKMGPTQGQGTYLTVSPEEASRFSKPVVGPYGGGVYKVEVTGKFLRLSDEIDAETYQALVGKKGNADTWDDAVYDAERYLVNNGMEPNAAGKAVADKLRKMGYDGLIENTEGTDNYIVWDPGLIKNKLTGKQMGDAPVADQVPDAGKMVQPAKFKPKEQKGYDKGENLDLVGMAKKREPAPAAQTVATPKVETRVALGGRVDLQEIVDQGPKAVKDAIDDLTRRINHGKKHSAELRARASVNRKLISNYKKGGGKGMSGYDIPQALQTKARINDTYTQQLIKERALLLGTSRTLAEKNASSVKKASMTPLPRALKMNTAPEYAYVGDGLSAEKVLRVNNVDARTLAALDVDYVAIVPGENYYLVGVKGNKVVRRFESPDVAGLKKALTGKPQELTNTVAEAQPTPKPEAKPEPQAKPVEAQKQAPKTEVKLKKTKPPIPAGLTKAEIKLTRQTNSVDPKKARNAKIMLAHSKKARDAYGAGVGDNVRLEYPWRAVYEGELSVSTDGQWRVGNAYATLGDAKITVLDKPQNQPAPKQDAPAKKEPWEMTGEDLMARVDEVRSGKASKIGGAHELRRDAFVDYRRLDWEKQNNHKVNKTDRVSFDFNNKKLHQTAVEQALKDGKLVPAEVLADYPDLAKKYEAPAKEPHAAPKPVAKQESGKAVAPESVVAPERSDSAVIRKAHNIPPAKNRIPMPEEWKSEKMIPGMGLRPSQRDFLVKELNAAKERGDEIAEVKVPGDGEWKIKTGSNGFKDLLSDLSKKRIQSDSGPAKLDGGGVTSANALYKMVKASDKIAGASGQAMPRIKFLTEVGEAQLEKEGWTVSRRYSSRAEAKADVKDGGWVESIWSSTSRGGGTIDYYAINPPKEIVESQAKNALTSQGAPPRGLIDTGLPISTKEWDAAVEQFNRAKSDNAGKELAQKALQEHVNFDQIVAALSIPERKRTPLQEVVANQLRASTESIVKGKPGYNKSSTYRVTLGDNAWWTDGNVMLKGELDGGVARVHAHSYGDKLVDDAGSRSPVQVVGSIRDQSIGRKDSSPIVRGPDAIVWHVVKDDAGEHFAIDRKHTALIEKTFGKDIQWTKGSTNSVFAEKDGQLVAVAISRPVKEFPIVSAKDTPLNQLAPKKNIQGQYVWDAKQKRGVVTLFENADISTILHETSHHYLRYTPESMYKAIAAGAGVDPNTDLDKLKRSDYVKVQEFWARGVEETLYRNAVNPNPKVQAAFNHAAKRIRQIYGEAGVPLPERVAGRTLNQSGKPDDYRGSHQAPARDNGAPSHDLLEVYPEDFYGPNGLRYYGDGQPFDAESYFAMTAVRGKPNAVVTVYRAVPNIAPRDLVKERAYLLRHGRDAYLDKYKRSPDVMYEEIERGVQQQAGEKLSINPGDWVTLSRSYAKQHGVSNLGGKFKILSKKVKASDLFTDGNSIHELGWDPIQANAKRPAVSNDPSILNQSNPQTKTPAFKKWFGDSKVVDENGEPLVVYKAMYPFDDNGKPLNVIDRPSLFPSFDKDAGVKIAGFFGDAKTASRFSEITSVGRNPLYPVYLKMSRPFVIDAKGGKAGDIQFGKTGQSFRDAIRSGKYDGVIIKNTADEGTIHVALEPTQIKSAIANKGTFDPNDPSILNQRSGKGGDKPDYSAVSEVFAQMLGGTVKPIREGQVPVKSAPKAPVEAPDAMRAVGTMSHAQAELIAETIGLDKYEKIVRKDADMLKTANSLKSSKAEIVAKALGGGSLKDSEQVALWNEVHTAGVARKAILDKYKNGGAMSEADDKAFNALTNQLQENLTALNMAGSEAGRSLRARSLALGSDLSEMGVMAKFVAATGELPNANVQSQIAELTAKVAELTKQVETKKKAAKKSVDDAVAFLKSRTLNQLSPDEMKAAKVIARSLHDQNMSIGESVGKMIEMVDGKISREDALLAFRRMLGEKKAMNTRKRRPGGGEVVPVNELEALKADRVLLLRAQKELADLMQEELAKLRWETASGLQKTGIALQEFKDSLVSLVSSSDISGARQAFYGMIQNPKAGAKAFVDQIKALRKEGYEEIITRLQASDEWFDAMDHGLDLPGKPNFKEELFRGNTVRKVPGVGAVVNASDQAYETMVTSVRYEVYKMLEKRAKTDAERRLIASFANIMTGRTGTGAGKRYAGSELSKLLFWAPQYMFSRFEMAALPVKILKAQASPKIKAELLARWAGQYAFLVAGMGAIAAGTGGTFVTDPEDGDFGKVVWPSGAELDAWAGFRPVIRLGLDMLNPKRKGENVYDREADRFSRMYDFGRGKLNPALNAAHSFVERKDAINQGFGVKDFLKSFLPLGASQSGDALVNGLSTTEALGVIGNMTGAFDLKIDQKSKMAKEREIAKAYAEMSWPEFARVSANPRMNADEVIARGRGLETVKKAAKKIVAIQGGSMDAAMRKIKGRANSQGVTEVVAADRLLKEMGRKPSKATKPKTRSERVREYLNSRK